MGKKSHRDLGMGNDIARRDFLQGMAVGVTLGGLAPELAEAAGQEAGNAAGYYPPTRMGMRGDHPGAFEAAHELRDGDFWNHASKLIDDTDSYDLVVAGGGISGLSAAWFYRAANPGAKILIIENHDDFGGHAKRNEFHVNGRMELINGGTLGIESPYPYSPVASGLLRSLGVEPAKLSKECDIESVYRGMGRGVFFDRETFGEDRFVWLDNRVYRQSDPNAWPAFLEKAPLTPAVKRSILKIQTGKDNYLPGLGGDETKDRLSRISYKDYFLQIVKADPGVVPFYQHITDEWWGVGFDAISALDCWAMGYPGFDGLKLKPGGPSLKRMGYTPAGYSTAGGSEEFHFPDGNASIARLLVRALIPASIPGKDAHDIVSAKADYAALDVPGTAVRIRLNNIVVRARNVAKGVEVAYAASRGGGPVRRVRAKTCVLAGFNAMIPYIVPELPEPQKKALHALVRCPLVYTNVALANWKPFHARRVRRIEAPGSYHMSVTLNPTVDIGGYRSVRSPDEPNLIRMVRAPAKPGSSEYDQNRFGRMELLTTPFETFEHNIRDQLARMFAGTGFDPARDIEGIAVNRWAHGYAPEYNSLWDAEYDAQHGPNLLARQPFGRIVIANSDSGFAAYTDSAIDQAHRAVSELIKL
jgi:spermidine dehydrogenase